MYIQLLTTYITRAFTQISSLYNKEKKLIENEFKKLNLFSILTDQPKLLWKFLLLRSLVAAVWTWCFEKTELNLLVKRVLIQKKIVVLLFDKECQKFFNKKDSFN